MKASSMSFRARRVFGRRVLGGAAVLLTAFPLLSPAAVYTYVGGDGTNWSTTTDWSPNGNPGAGDTANLFDTGSANRTVIYDAAAGTTTPGTLGTLNFAETSGFDNRLQLAKSLSVTNAITLGATSGTATIDAQNFALTNSLLTVGSGGQLLLGASAQTVAVTFLTGSLVLNTGGTITTNSAVGTGTSSANVTTVQETVSGNFTMNGGTLNLTQSTTGGVRFQIGGNFTATGGTVNFNGANGIPSIYLTNPNTTATVGSGVTFAQGGTSKAQIVLSANGTQALNTATSSVYDIYARATGSGSFTKTITYNGTGTATVGTLYVVAGTAGATTTLQFGSDLISASNSALISANAFTPVGIANVDFAGHTFDGTAVTTGWNPTNTTTSTDTLSLTSSTGTGTFRAVNFGFNRGTGSDLRITIGSGVVLEATGTAANAFGITTPTTGSSSVAFDANSTFRYVGTASTITTTSTGTGAVNTTLGKLTVGNGTTASVLTASSSLTTAGAVTINTLGTLNMGANILTGPGAGQVTIAGRGSLGANVIDQTLLNQISSASGSATTPAFLNLTATETLAAGALDFSTPGLANVSIGANASLAINGVAGSIIPANATYKLGSLGTSTLAAPFSVQGAVLSGANSLEVTAGFVRLATTDSSYTGATTIDNGATLLATTTGRIPATTAMTINAGGTYNLFNADALTTQTLASLSGAGTVTNTSTTATGGTPGKTILINGAAATTFSGTITEGGSGGTLALTRAGTGTLTLSGTSNYTAGTNITGGTLLINGANTGGGAVTLSGGTLGGTSTLAGALTMTGGTITGGTAGTVGLLTLTSNAALNGGTYLADISGATSDRLLFSNSTLTLGGVSLTINGTPDGATTYDIATYTSQTGTFASVTNLPANYTVTYGATDIFLTPTAVPEPSTLVIPTLLIAMMAGAGWRRSRRTAA